ncbi:hypothetical protein Anacy_1627 [Anabaena cylindrica PCC 7122]|uniref:Uncharacterized protein n=1 Tax=Anabaena cylindrica (strain ATCC 27899 / PCC 7122) TaxID=272123 RepID=K9ZEH0_ANACC|nr:hypothetical protein Anacy_1627 [Anabaena cylindrica PCC 7122]BAY05901.1 hypothetical protein NIES19_51780 [Anabaena cylindrica PCC 7122]
MSNQKATSKPKLKTQQIYTKAKKPQPPKGLGKPKTE